MNLVRSRIRRPAAAQRAIQATKLRDDPAGTGQISDACSADTRTSSSAHVAGTGAGNCLAGEMNTAFAPQARRDAVGSLPEQARSGLVVAENSQAASARNLNVSGRKPRRPRS
jgi:hypothetical protein